MPLNDQTFANDIKFRSSTYLIEEFGTYLIRSKVKTAPPPHTNLPYPIRTCLTFDSLTILVLSINSKVFML